MQTSTQHQAAKTPFANDPPYPEANANTLDEGSGALSLQASDSLGKWQSGNDAPQGSFFALLRSRTNSSHNLQAERIHGVNSDSYTASQFSDDADQQASDLGSYTGSSPTAYTSSASGPQLQDNDLAAWEYLDVTKDGGEQQLMLLV